MRLTFPAAARCRLALLTLWLGGSMALAADFPGVDQLPSRPELPDPLVMFDGWGVTAPEQWTSERRPELKALFRMALS